MTTELKRYAVLLALMASFLWSVPAFAGKAALSENDMDGITAAGEPKVIDADAGPGTNLVSYLENTTLDMGFGEGAQNNLKALILNNVLGEQSVATALNVGTGGGSRSGSQANSIDQSWGSTKDLVPGVDPVGSIPGATKAGSDNTFNGTRCIFGPCAVGNNARVINNPVILSAYADLIIDAVTCGCGGTANVITATQENNYELDVGTSVIQGGTSTGPAGVNLAALVVNNAVGQNLVAAGWNIVAGTVGGSTPPIISSDAAGLGQTNQSNTSNQFRGAPIGWNALR